MLGIIIGFDTFMKWGNVWVGKAIVVLEEGDRVVLATSLEVRLLE